MTEYTETPEETIYHLRERINELETDRSIKQNRSRRFAQYVVDHCNKKSARHNDFHYDLLKAAQQHLIDAKSIPYTTPWLIQMMEVARCDINDLPQQVFQLKEDVHRLTEECTELENELQILKDTMYDTGVERDLRT